MVTYVTAVHDTEQIIAEKRLLPVVVIDDARHAVPLAPEEVLPAPAHPATQGRLDGSILSPRTWASTLDFLRDRTTRR